MSEKRAFSPDGLCDPVEDYDQPWSHAVAPTGSPIHVSGQTPVDEAGAVVHQGDMKRQFRTVLKNLDAVLRSAGGDSTDLTEVTIYVTDMDRWRDKDVSDVRYDFFEEPYPCSTLVEVEGLVHDEMLVEVKAIAHVETPVTE